jgi:hypothetical protein
MAAGKSEGSGQARAEIQTLRGRLFPILMIVFCGLDLVSRIRHPSQRLNILHHLPLYFGSLLGSSTAGWILSAVVDLGLLWFFGALIPAARSKAEAGLYWALVGAFLLPPLRYFLPGVRVPLWWMECVVDVLVGLPAVALLAEVSREGADKAASSN